MHASSHAPTAHQAGSAWTTPEDGQVHHDQELTRPGGWSSYHGIGQQTTGQHYGSFSLIGAGILVAFGGLLMTILGFVMDITALGVTGVVYLVAGIVMTLLGSCLFIRRSRAVEDYHKTLREAESSAKSGQIDLQVSTVQLTPHCQTVGYPPRATLPTASGLVAGMGMTHGKDFEPPPSFSMATADYERDVGLPVVS